MERWAEWWAARTLFQKVCFHTAWMLLAYLYLSLLFLLSGCGQDTPHEPRCKRDHIDYTFKNGQTVPDYTCDEWEKP